MTDDAPMVPEDGDSDLTGGPEFVMKFMAGGLNVGGPPTQLTEEQTGKLIEFEEANAQRRYELDNKRREDQRFVTVYVFTAAIVGVIAVSWLFLAYDKSELVQPLLTFFAGLAAGGLGGYGLRGRAE